MSKALKSESRSKSGSGSRSRSLSRSRSRSRSRKHRYSSRSRSRSRSHSPPHSRERNYPREYQNNREFRGYHRGFRRPYYYRGRGRGYFPRGRYQRGGGGGYNNNFRPNNWQNYRPHPQQQQQQQHPHPHSPKRGRSRSRTPKKRSGTPKSRSRSRYSDRSSSGRSSSSSSRSASPKRRSGSDKRAPKDAKLERPPPKDAVTGGRADEERAEPPGGATGAEPAEGEGLSGNWQGLTEYNSSPAKRVSPLVRSAVIVGQTGTPATNQSSPSPKSANPSGNGAPAWQSVGNPSTTKSPSQKSPTPVFSGFGFFSKDDRRGEDKTALSAAFKKFLEEHKKRECENGRDPEENGGATDKPSPGGIFDNRPGHGASKPEKVKHNDFEGGGVSGSFQKAPPFLRGEDEEPRPQVFHKDSEASKAKGRVTLSARELFQERFGQWEDLGVADDEPNRGRKQKAVALAASGMFRGFSPERMTRVRGKERAASSPSPTPHRRAENRDRDVDDSSPPRASGKRGAEFSVRMDSVRNDMASSGALASERRLSRDLVHPGKKEQEFRSIFQHIQASQLRASPLELFAQHIVTIVHHIKAQHFPSSGMTLNERFALYQRQAAEKESMKCRKSPEIHRRIDVSPSAFRKRSHLFEEMKESGESSYKERGIRMKGDSLDLRLDIERRKQFSGREGEPSRGREPGDSPPSSRERSTEEKASKHHKKNKKSKKKRERSRSSSSSSSSSHRAVAYPHEEPEARDEGFNRARLGPRDYGGPMERGRPRGGFQFRIRGRGWNRGNYQGNNHSNGNPLNMGMGTNMPVYPKNEDWDPEYTPKSRKYYLHDDRDREAEKKWVDNRGRARGNFTRGRGRFIFRKTTLGTNGNSPKWTHDKFQGGVEEGELQVDDTEQDHKDEVIVTCDQ